MRHFTSRLSGILLVAFSLLIVASYFAEETPSDSDSVVIELGLDICPLPCWAGITPGITPLSAVLDGLVAVPLAFITPPASRGNSVAFTIHGGEQAWSGSLYADMQGIVNQIRLNLTLPTQYLFQQLGRPDCALYPNPSSGISVIWQRGQTSILTVLLPDADGDIHLDGYAQFIDIRGDGIHCTQPQTLPWLGFVPSWRYAEALNNRP